MNCIAYRAGYKYQLVTAHTVAIPLRPDREIVTDYLRLDVDGRLTISRGYAWDGPSGPTLDTLNFMRASLVHDALYQLMREGHLPRGPSRRAADALLRAMCREDGMSWLRAGWIYLGVRWWGDPAADPASRRPVVRAPAGCGG